MPYILLAILLFQMLRIAVDVARSKGAEAQRRDEATLLAAIAAGAGAESSSRLREGSLYRGLVAPMLTVARDWSALEWMTQQIVALNRAARWHLPRGGIPVAVAFWAFAFLACSGEPWTQTAAAVLIGLTAVGLLLRGRLSGRLWVPESALLRVRAALAERLNQRPDRPVIVPELLGDAELGRWRDGLEAIEREAEWDVERARTLHDERADAMGRVAP